MKGRKNYFTRESQLLGQSDKASKCPKSTAYRIQLEPFIGSCIEIVAQCCTYKKSICDNRLCVKMLLTDITIVKVPAKLRDNPLSHIDHLWVVLDKHWECPANVDNGLLLRGFVYEYENKGKKNIGLKVVSTKAYNTKRI